MERIIVITGVSCLLTIKSYHHAPTNSKRCYVTLVTIKHPYKRTIVFGENIACTSVPMVNLGNVQQVVKRLRAKMKLQVCLRQPY